MRKYGKSVSRTLAAILILCAVKVQAKEIVSLPGDPISFVLDYNTKGELVYDLSYKGVKLIEQSPIGMNNADGVSYTPENFKIELVGTSGESGTLTPVWGKRSMINKHYIQKSYQITPLYPLTNEHNTPPRVYLEVRVYEGAVAFRYRCVLPQPPYEPIVPVNTIIENTKFNFAGDFTAWYYNGERHNIGPELLSRASGERLPVMTIKAKDNIYMAIHEADVNEKALPMRLQTEQGSTSFSVVTEPLDFQTKYISPWRVILLGETPGALVDSDVLTLLNPEPAKGMDFSWVKPGIALWDWRINGAEWDGYRYGMNYDSWVRMVDFASEQGFAYLVLDANWYGPEFEKNSDPVTGEKAKDVQRIIKYGKEKGVGIWLYLNDVAGTNYPIEETLEQYEEWGAAGVKYGFMNGNTQQKNEKTRQITELCAKHHLLINFHDYPVHPYGQERTWPNAVTREYCKAQLDGHQTFEPKTFVTSVFVNMIAGPIDMNNGFMDLRQGRTTRVDNNQEVHSTVSGEMARTLITYSGVTIIPDIPEYYEKYPSLLRFLSAQKMPWKESKTLMGEIGEYIVMMRQSAEGDYLIGAATNEEARTLEIPLNFLDKKGSWTMEITQDAPDTHYLTNRETYSTRTEIGTSKGVLKLELAPGGGACVLLKKR